jgi:hypothetical protein
MKRIKRNTGRTTLKYLRFLENLQYELDSFNYKNLVEFPKKYNVTQAWPVFLKRNGIIYKNRQGYYKWNNKIPASINIIKEFREYNDKTTNYTNGIAKVNPKKVIKVPPKMIREDFKNTAKQELGLIRRFLKWIY